MKESDVEKYLNDQVKKIGGITRKWVSPGHAGVPDRIVIFPGGFIFFCEVKTDKGKLSVRQERELDELSRMGCTCTIIFGYKGVDMLIKTLIETVSTANPPLKNLH